MQKIHCRHCGKSFLWTDGMPLAGKCPNPACEGRYDVRQALRESVAARAPENPAGPVCPACGQELHCRWAICLGCGRIVAGGRAFRRLDLLLAVVIVLLAATLLIRYALGP